ncbi:MAG: glycosyltransferase family 2 protein, partial [Mesorhizobium sp.]
MIEGLRVTVVMPAYNASATLERTYSALPLQLVDDVILTDDLSKDDTVAISKKLNIHTIEHSINKGYGGNQKTCYDAALERGADIVVMLHPDYQYSPRLVPAIASMVASGEYDFVFGSRILGKGALRGGMPIYKYIANRFLTLVQNILIGQKMSEFHTGFRCWSRKALTEIPYHRCS